MINGAMGDVLPFVLLAVVAAIFGLLFKYGVQFSIFGWNFNGEA